MFQSGTNMNIRATLTASGRLSLPATLRKKYGLIAGTEVVVTDTGDALMVRSVDQVIAQSQARVKALGLAARGASVDDFLADRKVEANGE
jgi:bifunctional DNA-binding transcriptional regulator/antitoxin component of YhaV-PrlF toxin-antitoxin module